MCHTNQKTFLEPNKHLSHCNIKSWSIWTKQHFSLHQYRQTQNYANTIIFCINLLFDV